MLENVKTAPVPLWERTVTWNTIEIALVRPWERGTVAIVRADLDIAFGQTADDLKECIRAAVREWMETTEDGKAMAYNDYEFNS